MWAGSGHGIREIVHSEQEAHAGAGCNCAGTRVQDSSPVFWPVMQRVQKPKAARAVVQVWDEWSKLDNGICVDVWKDALRNLDGLNGMEYVKANGEVAYRKEIVTTVCDLMQRTSQDEIVVVERAADSDAHEFDLHQPGRGATRGFKRFILSCFQTTLIVYLVVAVTMLLALYFWIRPLFSRMQSLSFL